MIKLYSFISPTRMLFSPAKKGDPRISKFFDTKSTGAFSWSSQNNLGDRQPLTSRNFQVEHPICDNTAANKNREDIASASTLFFIKNLPVVKNPKKKRSYSLGNSVVEQKTHYPYQVVKTPQEAKKILVQFMQYGEPIYLDLVEQNKTRVFQYEGIVMYQPDSGCYLFPLESLHAESFFEPLIDYPVVLYDGKDVIEFLKKNYSCTLENIDVISVMGALLWPVPNFQTANRQMNTMAPDYLKVKEISHVQLACYFLEENLEELANKPCIFSMHELHCHLLKELDQHDLKQVYQIYLQGLRIFAAVEIVGMPVAYASLKESIQQQQDSLIQHPFIKTYAFQYPLKKKAVTTYITKYFSQGSFPRTPKTDDIDLSKNTLRTIMGGLPVKQQEFLTLFLEYKQKEQMYKEHEKLLKHVNLKDYRVYPRYEYLKSSSGRSCSQNPNIQGLKKEIKQYIGYENNKELSITSGDYSQQELRVFALLTENEPLLKDFANGVDGYRSLASRILKKNAEEITHEERQIFKILTLSLIYGKGINRLVEEMSDTHISYEDIMEIQQEFNLVKIQDILTEIHRQSKKIETLLGVKKRPIFDHWETLPAYQLLNYSIQGTAVNIGICAMNCLYHNLSRDCQIIGYVHDEIIVQHPTHKTEEVQTKIKEAMVQGFLDCLPKAHLQKDYLVTLQSGSRWKE